MIFTWTRWLVLPALILATARSAWSEESAPVAAPAKTAAAASAAPAPAAGGFHTTFEPQGGTVEFLAVGRPSMLKIVGKGVGPQGSLQLSPTEASGEFKLDLNGLNTGISMRDRHMKEKYLQVEQYPTATFRISSLKFPKAFDGKDAVFKELPFEGVLKLHGVEKPIQGKADVKVENSKLAGTASFDLKLTDYKIDIPKFAGVTVAEDVKVTVQGSGSLDATSK